MQSMKRIMELAHIEKDDPIFFQLAKNKLVKNKTQNSFHFMVEPSSFIKYTINKLVSII